MYETLYEFTKTECYLKSLGAGIIEVALWICILFIVIRNYFKSKKMIKDVPNGFIVRTILSNLGGYVVQKYIFNPNGDYDDESELKYIEDLIVNAFSL